MQQTVTREQLSKLYNIEGLSVSEIAVKMACSVNKVIYWMDKYNLPRRTISEAIYKKHNPNGDPFSLKPIKTVADARLLGVAAGIYWGEGTKSNKHSVRLGNTDPALLRTFIRFLVELCGVGKDDMRFGLQIFTDIDPQEAQNYWMSELGLRPSQFYKITVTISGSIGTYRQKSRYGVLTLYYHNKKLRDIVVNLCRDSSVGRARLW